METGRPRPVRAGETRVLHSLVQHKHRAYSGVGLLYCQIELSF
jgi:hypothetical protein